MVSILKNANIDFNRDFSRYKKFISRANLSVNKKKGPPMKNRQAFFGISAPKTVTQEKRGDALP
jgi:hypothetical protein